MSILLYICLGIIFIYFFLSDVTENKFKNYCLYNLFWISDNYNNFFMFLYMCFLILIWPLIILLYGISFLLSKLFNKD
jgi:hypothetical protein